MAYFTEILDFFVLVLAAVDSILAFPEMMVSIGTLFGLSVIRIEIFR